MVFGAFAQDSGNKKDLAAALATINKIEEESKIAEHFKTNFPDYNIPLVFKPIFDKMFAENWDNYIAKNTQNLGGKPAEKFLKKFAKNCEEGQYVIGIGVDNNILCGYNHELLVNLKVRKGQAKYGISGQTIDKIAKENESIAVKKRLLIENPEGELELVFEDDGSLLRLWTGSRIAIDPKFRNSRWSTLAQVSYEHGLIWGRVLSDDIVRFENGGLIAGVRGTSVMMAANGVIDVLQSKLETKAVMISMENQGWETDFPACQRFTKNALWNYNSDSLIKSTNTLRQPMYCNIEDEKVAENTIKDIAYLNEIKDPNDKEKKNPANAERSIAGPEEVAENRLLCKDATAPIFWPDVTDPNAICQPENVVAILNYDASEKVAKIYINSEDGEILDDIKITNANFRIKFNEYIKSFSKSLLSVDIISGSMQCNVRRGGDLISCSRTSADQNYDIRDIEVSIFNHDIDGLVIIKEKK